MLTWVTLNNIRNIIIENLKISFEKFYDKSYSDLKIKFWKDKLIGKILKLILKFINEN